MCISKKTKQSARKLARGAGITDNCLCGKRVAVAFRLMRSIALLQAASVITYTILIYLPLEMVEQRKQPQPYIHGTRYPSRGNSQVFQKLTRYLTEHMNN